MYIYITRAQFQLLMRRQAKLTLREPMLYSVRGAMDIHISIYLYIYLYIDVYVYRYVNARAVLAADGAPRVNRSWNSPSLADQSERARAAAHAQHTRRI